MVDEGLLSKQQLMWGSPNLFSHNVDEFYELV